jgi:ribulose-5-phosphate 4-epimerase/fuculose-1-phosphate aldolase
MDLSEKLLRLKPEAMNGEEWQIRLELAALYRAFDWLGWTESIYNHITARVPGAERHYLINPYGLNYNEVTATNLVKVNLAGETMDGSKYPVNRAGFVIHSAIHAAREDAHCVLHTHTINGVAVSAQKDGLLPISQQSIFPLSSIGYHAYEGVALRDEEKPRLVRDLGDRSFLMLRNHGLLTVGETVADAFLFMYIFEAACAIQLRAQGSPELVQVDPRIIAGAQAQARQVTRGAGAALAWPGLLRKLDRLDASFRS